MLATLWLLCDPWNMLWNSGTQMIHLFKCQSKYFTLSMSLKLQRIARNLTKGKLYRVWSVCIRWLSGVSVTPVMTPSSTASAPAPLSWTWVGLWQLSASAQCLTSPNGQSLCGGLHYMFSLRRSLGFSIYSPFILTLMGSFSFQAIIFFIMLMFLINW